MSNDDYQSSDSILAKEGYPLNSGIHLIESFSISKETLTYLLNRNDELYSREHSVHAEDIRRYSERQLFLLRTLLILGLAELPIYREAQSKVSDSYSNYKTPRESGLITDPEENLEVIRASLLQNDYQTITSNENGVKGGSAEDAYDEFGFHKSWAHKGTKPVIVNINADAIPEDGASAVIPAAALNEYNEFLDKQESANAEWPPKEDVGIWL